MKNNIFRTCAIFGAAVATLSIVSAACAQQSAELLEANRLGANMQSAGIMSQGDYVRVRELGHSVSSTHAISDADLKFTLRLLKTATNSVARARAMTVLSEVRPMSPAQKAAIAPAVQPYLSSTDKLDRAGAQRVQKSLQAAE